MEVVAAVIERDGQILIGQRKPRGRHGLKWEFPGGKVEPGEEPRAALARELREELGIEAQIGEEIERYDFSYAAQAPTHLIFFRVTEFAGEPAESGLRADRLGRAPAACRNTIFSKAMWIS